MARKRKGRRVNGVLLVDKPQGVSSNDVVQHVRRAFKAAKAGHTGALDPLATGLLPICLGEATKFSQFLLEADKAYFVTAKLGERTDTSDADGEVVEQKPVNVSEQQIKQALLQFKGPIKQIPSMFSALKYEGKPLYYYARKGIDIDRPAREITIHNIDWIELKGDELSLHVSCSKGTYIRTLVDDLGQVLGCGAHVNVLRRTQVGHYDAETMITYEQLDASTPANLPRSYDIEGLDLSVFDDLDKLLLPMDTPIQSLSRIEVTPSQTEQFRLGQALNCEQSFKLGQAVRLYESQSNEFIGIANVTSDNKLQPKRVVVYS
jgi:tRNA pseudouridine55 synthase